MIDAEPLKRDGLRRQGAVVMRLLRQTYPKAVCTLDHIEPWQLLVAAILSAQCTDARVNVITPALFRHFPDVRAMAEADQAKVEELIRSCGLFRTKARSIIASSQAIVAQHLGRVPDTLEALTSLPGVGRKIANLILGDAYGVPAIVVDTHCARISALIGLTDHTDPARVEKDLAEVLDPADWIDYGHLMVEHGRTLCVARRPDCANCPLAPHCRYAAGS